MYLKFGYPTETITEGQAKILVPKLSEYKKTTLRLCPLKSSSVLQSHHGTEPGFCSFGPTVVPKNG